MDSVLTSGRGGVRMVLPVGARLRHDLMGAVRRALDLCFEPPILSNFLGELKELKRTSSMEEYQRCFLALLCCCDDLTP